jgi:hypothetical protein
MTFAPGPTGYRRHAQTRIISSLTELIQDAKTRDVGLGLHIADLSIKALPEGNQVEFTFHWPEADRWEGKDFVIHIGSTTPNGSCSAQRSMTDAR